MPLYKNIRVNENTEVLIWKITEELEDIMKGVSLQPSSLERMESMKSELHKKGFASIRQLLKERGYTDADMWYDNNGKPYLSDGTYISITHSFEFTGIILSKNARVGIDIEKQRDKILRIAHKFTPIEEYRTIANHDALIRKLTIVWGGKESLYKIYGKKKLLFLHNIYIEDFKFDSYQTTGEIRYHGKTSKFEVQFLEFENFTCVYAY